MAFWTQDASCPPSQWPHQPTNQVQRASAAWLSDAVWARRARGVPWSTQDVTCTVPIWWSHRVSDPASFRRSERATKLLTRISVADGCGFAARTGTPPDTFQHRSSLRRGAVQLHRHSRDISERRWDRRKNTPSSMH